MSSIIFEVLFSLMRCLFVLVWTVSSVLATTAPTLLPTTAPTTARSSQYSVKLFAGTGTSGSTSGTGGQATAAGFTNCRSVWLDTADVVYINMDTASCIKTVDSSGIVHAFAGVCGTSGSSGDGGAASAALMSSRTISIFVSTVGSLSVADFSNHKIRSVSTSGIMSTVVGTGTGSTSGDGGKATSANVYGPHGVWCNSVGTMYIASYADNLVRSVSTANIILTFAG